MVKYSATVVGIGEEAQDLIDNNLCIIFNENAPPELAELSVRHTIEVLSSEVSEGDVVTLAGKECRVLEVGSEANKTLAELGHCTFYLHDGVKAMKRCLPGYIVLLCREKPKFAVGQAITIYGGLA